ncbi:3'(2'),5'-bisphosphate nucleotidase CysQ [uncultured Croceitalea sp.]|uniref:3'(2'),5'-bisphosphate nucleotidase CysQ n=1 Tax=uncultured Croceitalea sp. TaxID=1798908 RepID=UPI003305ED92
MKITDDILNLAITTSIEAGKEILKIYNREGLHTELKDDKSPLTEADIASNRVILNGLQSSPFPIINEEIKNEDYTSRKKWDLCWVVDPLDGTKEFIKRNGEFTVNIALCKNGNPIFGVIYVPVTRELYYGIVSDNKSFKTKLNTDHTAKKGFFEVNDEIEPSSDNSDKIRVVGSRSHMNEDTQAFIDNLEKSYKEVEIVSKGSSLKFCMVAEGIADVYPRYAPTMEWDTAAGHAICSAVGLKVTSNETDEELKYNKENLLNPYFLVAK